MKSVVILILLIIIFLYLHKNKEQFQNQKCNVYLISNKSNITSSYKKKINNLAINPNDKVVRFNHSGNDDILPNRTDIAVFRNNKYNYWGNGKPIWKNLQNSEVLLLGKNKNTNLAIKDLEKKNNKVEVINYEKVKFTENNKVNNKTESSGKIVINHLQNKDYIDKIYLIGFDFYKGVNNWHNFKAEENFVNSNPNVIQL